MESPQMYDNNVQSINQLDIKKGTMATNNINNNNNNHSVVNNNNSNNNNNNNTASAINHNTMAANKTTHQMLQANNTNNNTILQKHILQQYSQSDLEELASQEISLDLQHLIDDQFREQEALGIFSDMEPNTNNNNPSHNNNNNNNNSNGTLSVAAKVLQHQNRLNQQQQQSQGYQRATLAYMPQPVHSGANYTNNSSDDNSSIGSDGTNIKEEPVDTAEFRRLAAAANGAQFIGVNQDAAGLYQIPQNYTSNGSGNTFTTLTAPVLHHQGLPHLPGSHLASLKHKQLMSQRKHQNKHVDKGTDEYRRRRERNNIAVRKSREKAKVRSREVEEKVKALVKEKEALMRRLEEMTNEIQLHKQLYVHLMNHNNPEVNNICRNVLSLVSGDHGM